LSSQKLIGRCIQEQCEVSENWTTVKIKVYGYSNSFKKAKLKASIAIDTSHIGSDSSEEEIKSRKRRAPAKYNRYDTEEDTTTSSKRKKHHQIPRTPQITSSLLNMLPASNENRTSSHSLLNMIPVSSENRISSRNGSVHSPTATPLTETSLQNSLINRLLQSIERLQTDVMAINKKIDTVNRKVDAVLCQLNGRDFSSVSLEPHPLGIQL
ncbi:unnamed protein product, partial [Larinioides sclopetarius]